MPGRPFEKGWQGGPGRPKGSMRVQICKEYAEKEGFARLIEIAKGIGRDKRGNETPAGWAPVPGKDGAPTGRLVWVGPSIELQFEALKLVLAYGFGKPTEFIDVTSGGESLADWAKQYFGSHPANASNGDPGRDSGLPSVPGTDETGPGVVPS